jgi:hypothetical protein
MPMVFIDGTSPAQYGLAGSKTFIVNERKAGHWSGTRGGRGRREGLEPTTR